MSYKDQIKRLTVQFNLTPFQVDVLENKIARYDLSRLVKYQDVLYVPYLYCENNIWTEKAIRFFVCPKCDLIGIDKMIAYGIRKS